MRIAHLASTLAVLALLVAPPAARAGDPATRLQGATGLPTDYFGSSVAISGDLVLVGSPQDDLGQFDPDVGTVFVFHAPTGQELHRIQMFHPASGELIGSSVALDGTLGLVGAPYINEQAYTGRVYVVDAAAGTVLGEYTASDGETGNHYGNAVDLDGTIGIVGAYFDDVNGARSGSAYLIDVTTGAELHKLVPGDGEFYDYFGWSVAIHGNLALVGAPGYDDGVNDYGAVYVFDVTTGAELAKVVAPFPPFTTHLTSFFGTSVDLGSAVAVVGAPYVTGHTGRAYVYDVATWSLTHTLAASDGAPDDEFGRAVATDDARVIVGATHHDDDGFTDTGAAYVYDAATGVELHELTSPDGGNQALNGVAVAIDGSRAVVGANTITGLWPGINDQGAAYVHDLDGSAWVGLGLGKLGSNGFPLLECGGDLTPNSPVSVSLTDAAATASTTLVLGLTEFMIVFKGGTLVPSPDFLIEGLPTDASGELLINTTWPAGLPSGLPFALQSWIVDPGATKNLAASNGVRGTTP
jgi:hypothetical protein